MSHDPLSPSGCLPPHSLFRLTFSPLPYTWDTKDNLVSLLVFPAALRSVCLYVCQSVGPTVHLHFHLSTHLPACLSVYLSIYLSIYLFLICFGFFGLVCKDGHPCLLLGFCAIQGSFSLSLRSLSVYVSRCSPIVRSHHTSLELL